MSSGTTSIYPQGNLNSPNSFAEVVYEFDRFRLDAAHRMLYENDQPVALAPKVVETLIALVERGDEIVAKEELMKRVWGDAAVEESNLTQNIYLLRKALGNAADGKPMIESFRRRGYRFNGKLRARERPAPVVAEEGTNGNAGARLSESLSEAATRWGAPVPHRRKTILYFAAGAIMACGLLLTAVFILRGSFKIYPPVPSVAALKITRLTPDLNIGSCAFAPDGTHLAYVLIEKGEQSIWMKDLVTGSASRILPPTEEGYGHIQFSSDGKTLYYATHRLEAPNSTIVQFPLAGGSERRVTIDAVSLFALSPDEKQVAFINGKGQLVVAQIEGRGERVLAEPGQTMWFALDILAWSADGERVVVGNQQLGPQGRRRTELLEISMRDGSIQPIAIPDWIGVENALWLPDQTGLIVIGRESETGPSQIWKVGNPSGAATRITNDTNSYSDIEVSPDSRRMVAIQRFQNLNIWTMPADASAPPRQVTFGHAAWDGLWGIAFTPDGKIIYTSPRDGHIDLWQMNADGSEQKQLTKNGGEYNGRPKVTPDGRFIVFTSRRSSKPQIWRIDADGANPRQLTAAEHGAGQPALSPDGRWVYFTVIEGGRLLDGGSIWKVSIDGSETTRVSPVDNAWSPAVSPDGESISYTFYDGTAAHPWKVGLMQAATGTPVKSFDVLFTRQLKLWTADSKALIFIGDQATNLWRLPIDTGKPRRLTNFESGIISYFALSPDGKQLAVARGHPSAEAVLLENF